MFKKKTVLQYVQILTLKMEGGGGGASQSFVYLNHQCRMGIPSRGYRIGIPGSTPVGDAHTASYIKLSYAGPSQHELSQGYNSF